MGNKIENKDKSAFACVDSDFLQEGLTKREYFVGQALQGYCSGKYVSSGQISEKRIAEFTIKVADEILKQLNK